MCTAVVAREIARLSAEEIGGAVGSVVPERFSRAAHLVAALAASRPSARLGEHLAWFDARIGAVGIARAAHEIVASFGAVIRIEGACPAKGPVLVVANHPGAYDALSLIAALGRDDVALVAADRPFLRALPNLRGHLVFVTDAGVLDRARGARRALERMNSGAAVVQFGAGAIEPDARFDGGEVLGAWASGTGLFATRAARCGAAVVPAFVSGVHSPRAKRLALVRWAERRGITTIAPLVQATFPGFRDVVFSVSVGAPMTASALRDAATDRDRTALLRAAVASLATR
jgi:1-acyl-sn-glycerol-3-phosphate acyltransferase